jgi:hypothetical protein
MTTTIHLNSADIKEAIAHWLAAKGYETVQTSLSHSEKDRHMGFDYTASATVNPKPPLMTYENGVGGMDR